MTTGEKIRIERKRKKYTQKELGNLCVPPIAESTIRRYELGKLNPKIETLQKIANALEVNIAELADNYLIIEPKPAMKALEKKIRNELEILNNLDNTSNRMIEPEEEPILDIFNSLNNKGQDKLIDYGSDLMEIHEYKRNKQDD
ncbi:MAG: helix-turn-helix transcriptional regulator [Anaerostipes sp.]|nr:helix-turn-helix transcriptional regulator [Anaerostipes sp.]MDD3747491.1 helix-turn-helix transcriptional regulator [Anaerostipes sp.]MDD4371272.1 helix-turn-helix transcriptional regulator [Anaerostipes sp.]